MDSPAVSDAEAPAASGPAAASGPSPAAEPAAPEAPAGPVPAAPPVTPKPTVVMDTEGSPDLPDISEFWPDAPHRFGPPADHYEPPGADPTRTDPAWHPTPGPNRPTVELTAGVRANAGRPTVELPRPPKPSVVRSGAILLSVLALGVAAAWLIVRPDATSPTRPVFGDGTTTPAPPAAAPANPPVSIEPRQPSAEAGTLLPVPSGDTATFELAEGITDLTVTIGPLDQGWFSVVTPDDASVVARTDFDDDTVRLRFDDSGNKGGPARADVVLSDSLTWDVRLSGGVRNAAVDLTGGAVSGVQLLGGAATVDLRLPEHGEQLPITMTGGVNQWRISTAGQAPAGVVLREGAGTVELYGEKRKGLAKGTQLSVGEGEGGIAIDAEAGLGTLTVTAR